MAAGKIREGPSADNLAQAHDTFVSQLTGRKRRVVVRARVRF